MRVNLTQDVTGFYGNLVHALGRQKVFELQTEEEIVEAYSGNPELVGQVEFVTENKRDLTRAFNEQLAAYVKIQNYDAEFDKDYAPFNLSRAT